MLELNETCEKFVAASSDKSKQGTAAAQTVLSSEMEVPSLEQSVQLSQASTDSTLTFDTISKKRWLDTQYLLDNDFLAQAPLDLRSTLQTRRDRDYDYLKPLTRLRNQVYIS